MRSKLQKIAGLVDLRHAPSTGLPAGSMKVQVELLHHIRASKPQRRPSELFPFVPSLLVTSHPIYSWAHCTHKGTQLCIQNVKRDKTGSVSSSCPYPQFLKTIMKKGRHIKQQGNYYISIVGYNNASFVTCSETIQDMHWLFTLFQRHFTQETTD